MAQKVKIIGAGVAGLTTAVELATRGLSVSVYERASSHGEHACSWYAGGMLAPWCEGESAEPQVVKYGQEAIAWWQTHLTGSETQLQKHGSIVLAPARDANELNRFSRRTDNHTQINAQTIAELEPDLKDRFSKALFYQDEAHIDPRLTMQALSQKLKALKVDIHYNSDMSSINNGADNEITIDARGFSAKDTLTNLRGVRGEMLLLQAKDINITRPIRLIHPRFPVYIVPRENNVYMVGATQIESEQQGGVSARGMVDLLNAAYAIHPAFADATILEMGADVRPAFPDNLPKLKWIDNTLYINGLFRHGFLLSPACAKMAADTILDRTYIPEFMDA